MQTLHTYYKSLTVVTFCVTLFSPNISLAASIRNGDFGSGDFTSWNQDVDGFGIPIAFLNDFTIVEPVSAGDYAARIEADYWSTPGDTFTPQDEAFFANTLFQGLDLSAAAGQNLILSFDWTFAGQEPGFDENFLVGLGDGSGNYYGADGGLGFLLNPVAYGAGSFSTTLDSSFANASGWTLEFQMNSGFDGLGSYATIDNVSLTAVPLPAAFWMMGLGLLGIAKVQRKNKVV